MAAMVWMEQSEGKTRRSCYDVFPGSTQFTQWFQGRKAFFDGSNSGQLKLNLRVLWLRNRQQIVMLRDGALLYVVVSLHVFHHTAPWQHKLCVQGEKEGCGVQDCPRQHSGGTALVY